MKHRNYPKLRSALKKSAEEIIAKPENLKALHKKLDDLADNGKIEAKQKKQVIEEIERSRVKKNLEELTELKNIFKFKGFSVKFHDHLLYGDIKIKIIHNQDKTKVKEVYEYVLSKGGKNKDEILPPWQVKVEKQGGIHMHTKIDGKLIKISKVKDTKTLHTGEKVDIVELEMNIMELGKLRKKPKSSTLWPKEWSIEKVKRITKKPVRM